MKKILYSIFISLGIIALMSHNALGAEIVNDSVSLYWTSPNLYFSCAVNQGSNYILNNNSCHLGSRAQVNSISFYPQVYYQLGAGAYFVEVYLRISNNANTDNTVWFGADSGNNMQFVSEEQVSSTTSGSITYRTYRLLYRYTGPQLLNNTNYMSIGSSGGMFAGESFKIMNAVFWQVNSSDTASVIQAINAQNQYLQDISQNLYIADGHLQDISDYLDFIRNEIPSAQDNADAIADEVEERVQDASDASETAGSDSSSDATTATSSLVSVIGGFVSAITSTSAGNCKIDGDIGHIDIGELDFCAINPPAYVSIIGSLILIAICIPFAIIMFNRFISLFRSFQG